MRFWYHWYLVTQIDWLQLPDVNQTNNLVAKIDRLLSVYLPDTVDDVVTRRIIYSVIILSSTRMSMIFNVVYVENDE